MAPGTPAAPAARSAHGGEGVGHDARHRRGLAPDEPRERRRGGGVHVPRHVVGDAEAGVVRGPQPGARKVLDAEADGHAVLLLELLEARVRDGGEGDEEAAGGEAPTEDEDGVDVPLQRQGDEEDVGRRRRRHGGRR
jgi:hypothetical protein